MRHTGSYRTAYASQSAHKILTGTAALFAAASCCLGAAHAGTIVTDAMVSQSAATQTNIPVTFGQLFKDGDVPKGETLAATLGGQAVPLQVDVKATNPDGSLRHVVLTVQLPSLAASASEPLALSTASPSTTGPAISLAQLLATRYDAMASFNIGGTTYSADSRALLQAAQSANQCAPWGTGCNLWLSGPLASEWVVNGPATTAGGTVNPNLQVYFAVRAYAGTAPGTVAYVRTDIVVENSSAYTPPALLNYTATLASGSASFTSAALAQYPHTRWHEVLWWNNNQPQVYPQQNIAYLVSTLAVPRYMALTPSASLVAGLPQSCAPLKICDQEQAMGDEGWQDGIGPLPLWTVLYLLDPVPSTYNWMLANTDALGPYGIHYRDSATDWPLSIVKHPDVTISDWDWANHVAYSNSPQAAQYKADLLPPNCSGCSNPDSYDTAHQPRAGYIPYMVTGSWYYMSEMAFDASYNEIWGNEVSRGNAQGLITNYVQSQVRGVAWTLRNIADAAYLLPDGYPLKSEFTNDVNNTLGYFNTNYPDNPQADALGILSFTVNGYTLNGASAANGIAPWMHNFLVWSIANIANQGFTAATPFLTWLSQMDIHMMTDWQSDPANGYCWLAASAYAVQVKDSSGNWLPSYTDVYKASFPAFAGNTCNSPAMVAQISTKNSGQITDGTSPYQLGQMLIFANSARGYGANLQAALAALMDAGIPGAQNAWNIFMARSVQPSGDTTYVNYPNFALLPRSATYKPIVSIYATPNPVAPGNKAVIYWDASAAASCSASWTTSTAVDSSLTTAAMTTATSYPITCTGPGGTTTASFTLGVGSAAPPPATTAPPAPTSTPPPTSAPPPASSQPPAPPTGNQPPTANPAAAAKSGGGAMSWLALLLLGALLGCTRIRADRHATNIEG